MPYTKQELIQELLRCYEENGEARTKILNDPETDYPTQMTYSNHFGSLTAAKESAGLLGGHTRERVVSDISECFNTHGNVSIKLLDNNNEFINSSTLYKHFDSLWTAMEAAGIDTSEVKQERSSNRDNMYTEEELLSKLADCKEEMGDTRTTTINKYDGCPSACPYQTQFGSLKNARDKAGINATFKNSGYLSNKIQSLESHNEDADAHIYVLALSVNNIPAYYVGETTNLLERMQSHFYHSKIQTWANTQHGKILAPRSETNTINTLEVEDIKYVIPLYQNENESDVQFRRRRKFKEHHEHLAVAIEHDTLEVYGGR